MDIALTFIIIFVGLMLSIYKGISIAYSLLLGLIFLFAVFLRRGFRFKALTSMMVDGGKKFLLVLNILLLIGAITAVWRASGTISYIVYYGIRLINPHYFILTAFLLCCAVSFLMGTSFGTVGTMGVILMVMVKSAHADINMAAGAIIAGAFFGDRCSPMSSSANLVASVTDTGLYRNVKNMFRTSVVPFILASAFYAYISHRHPLLTGGSNIGQEILKQYNISPIVILPAVIILVLAAFRVDVKLSMLLSIICGAVIGVIYQHQTLPEMFGYIFAGYTMPAGSALKDIMSGGGVISMLNVFFIVLISSAYAGILDGTKILQEMESGILCFSRRFGVFFTTMVVGIAAASVGCSQVLAVMITYPLVKNLYAGEGKDKHELALDIENTVIVISPLIPWNIAVAIPMAALSANAGSILYAAYLYLIPLTNLAVKKLASMRKNTAKSVGAKC